MSESCATNTNLSSDPLIRSSPDGRYRLLITDGVMKRILLECHRSADSETGGILIGSYTDDLMTAHIVEVTGAPADSRSSPTIFLRGIGGLLRLLRSRWNERGQYYLGEWHYHPHASPCPSDFDRSQMARIAADEAYSCRNPLLLIVGSTPVGTTEVYTGVYAAAEKRLISMIPQKHS